MIGRWKKDYLMKMIRIDLKILKFVMNNFLKVVDIIKLNVDMIKLTVDMIKLTVDVIKLTVDKLK
jgi:hypothetical protein